MATRTDNDEPGRAATLPTRTVLYVEDHPVNVLLMQALFAKRPHIRLVVAATGEEGLRAAIERRPELLLLDLRLPDCHGSELLQRLRAVPGLEQVPAVAVTAEDTHGVADAGFIEIWRKPLDMHGTLARIDGLLERRRVEREKSATTLEFAPGWSHAPGRHAPPSPIPFPAAAGR